MTLRPFAAAVAATALLASGCAADGGSATPIVTTPSAVSSSADVSPSAGASDAAWQKHTDAGAVAFVKHWLDVFNDMQQTGDTAGFASLNTADCETCANLIDITEGIYADGKLRSDGWLRPKIVPIDAKPGLTGFAVRLHQSPQIVISPNGRETYDGGMATFIAGLRWQANAWRMASWDFPS
ncbi:DUF6318 family protein [Nocardioides sp. GY 10127]|uniref:DUF6318 family protein n=1 Tax=Nocardioides sp. GY 10127 TaxID=2569762 RepID=UPI0010A7C9CE|nr:DUF6318 family protein [Nocardioides sp. GY 10127]TIC79443.1 hypothetical protein E8D37_17890 [Nocardioides sp. GY 10127]